MINGAVPLTGQNTPPVIGHNRLDYIKRQIAAGYERAVKGGTEWIEGSLIMAAALREARYAIPSDVSFSGWLKENKLDFILHHDRAAMIRMAADLDVMRTVLTETDSRSFKNIWLQNRKRFVQMDKPHESKAKRYRKPRVHRPRERKMNHRRMKLGDEVVDALKGTSLDRSDEMDELVKLNRGAPEGELTKDVQHLVAQARAGKDVSAIAFTQEINLIGTRKRPSLTDAWRKRMVHVWEQATYGEQQKLIEYLMEHMKKGP